MSPASDQKTSDNDYQLLEQNRQKVEMNGITVKWKTSQSQSQ